jgi:hypothetical protein
MKNGLILMSNHRRQKKRYLPLFILLAVLMFFSTGCEHKPSSQGISGNREYLSGTEPLYAMPDGIETRWVNAENPAGMRGHGGKTNNGRKGSPCLWNFKAGEKSVLAEVVKSSGIVRRIWVTVSDRSPEMLRGLKLEMFWDEAEKPAVSAPLGDFFCQGLGEMATFESALFSSPEGRSFNCYIPMPFRTGMRIEVTNESGKDLELFFYQVDYTIGDRLPDNVLYFHAYYRRENPTVLKKDYTILPKIEGNGRYIGCNIGVNADRKLYFKSWWGEGEVKIYLDGDEQYPTLCGTGTEDYIGTGWGQGRFDNLYQGCSLADTARFRYCFYRLHVPDPVYFRNNIRITIQQIGYMDENTRMLMGQAGMKVYKAGGDLVPYDLSHPVQGLFERQDDWSSCVWFYLDKPFNNLPDIDPAEKRLEASKQKIL